MGSSNSSGGNRTSGLRSQTSNISAQNVTLAAGIAQIGSNSSSGAHI